MSDSKYAQINDFVQKLEEAAYNKGWKDAVAHILNAAQMPGLAPVSGDVPKDKKKRGGRKAGPDSTILRVLTAIQESPGQTGIELVESLTAQFPEIEERTIRTSFKRLHDRKAIKNLEGAWFPVS